MSHQRALLLFDVDGTLLRVGDRDHVIAMEEALSATFGVEATLDGVPKGGSLDREIARQALQNAGLDTARIQARLQNALDAMCNRYADRVGERHSWRLPGVPETITRLASAGHHIGILSGGAQTVARAKLHAAGLEEHFPVGAYGDQADRRADLVAIAIAAASSHYEFEHTVESTILIGDTPGDIDTARRSGCRILAVATGRWTLDQLSGHGPDALVADMGDWAPIVDAMAQLGLATHGSAE